MAELMYGDRVADHYRSFLTTGHTVPFGDVELPPDPSSIFGDPGVGFLYYGIDIGANDDPPSSPGVGGGYSTRETQFGHRMGCLRSYFSLSSLSAAITRCSQDLTAGRVPVISIKVDGLGGTNNGWTNFANGTGDATIISFLNSLAAIGKGPILVCLHHEPNFDGSSSEYLRMCRHMLALMGSSYPRIVFVGGFLADSFFYTNQRSPALAIADWIQPDSCHIPGLDFYHPDDFPGNSSWRNFANSFASTEAQLTSIYGGLDNMPPLALGEWGVHTWSPNTSLTISYMNDIYNWFLTYGYCMAYFDAVGTLWTTLDQQGKINAAASFDGETGPPWIRKDKFAAQLALSSSKFIPLGGLT
jgi:hypothetical protein